LNHRFNTDNPIREVLFSPDEEYIIVPVWPRQLQTIRVRDGAVVNEWKEHSATITHMAFSPAGDRLAAAFSDNTIRVFEFPSGRPEHLFLGHSKRAWQVAWSPAEDALASVGEDGTVRLWDLKQGSQRLHFKLPTKRNSTNEQVEDFAYLKDGVHVSGICEGKSFVWDVTTGKSVSSDQVAEPGTKVYAPPVVDALFPGAMSNVLAKWDPQSIFIRPRHSLDVIGRPIGTSNSIRVRRDGSEIVQIWYDKLRRWSIEPLELIDERTIGSPKSFDVVFDISHDGKRVCGVSVGDGRPKGPVKICDLNQATCVALEKFEDIREAHFSPGGDRVVLMSPGVPEYDAYTGAKIREYVDRSIPLGTINYSADGQRLAVYSLLGYTTIHDVATGEETIRLEGGAVGLLFASDGTSMVMSGAPDGGLFFWPGKK
jgi:WD40 repeat protein